MPSPIRLATALAAHLAAGHPLSPEARDYCRAAFGVQTVDHEAIWRILDDESPEREALVELALFPGHALQEELEPLLEEEGFGPKSEGQVAELLLSMAPAARFGLPDGSTLSLPLRREDARLFVRRLRIGRTPPEELRQAAGRRLDGSAATRLMVLLRHESWPDTPQARFLLAGALERVSGGEEDTAEAVRHACRLLTGLAPGDDILAALKARHAEARLNLGRARRLEALRESENMETLLARGVREPLLDADALSRELAITDALCRAAYGVPASELGPVEEDLGEFDGEDGARRLLDLWSG